MLQRILLVSLAVFSVLSFSNLAQAKKQLRKPASLGFAELPAKNSQLPLLIPEEDTQKLLGKVMFSYEKTTPLKLEILVNKRVVTFTADLIQAGNWEPDGQIPYNILAVRSGEEPLIFTVGPLLIQSVKKIGKAKVEVSGIGGMAYMTSPDCKGFETLNRKMTIELQATEAGGLSATYVESSDQKSCIKN